MDFLGYLVEFHLHFEDIEEICETFQILKNYLENLSYSENWDNHIRPSLRITKKFCGTETVYEDVTKPIMEEI
jgi:hypothetical protein